MHDASRSAPKRKRVISSYAITRRGVRQGDNGQVKFALVLALASVLAAQDDAAAHYQRGKEALQKQQWQQAADEFVAALKVQPNYLPARLELARLQVAARQFEPAVAALNALLQADPNNVDAEVVRAAALIGMNKPGVARLFLQDAVKKQPGAADLWFEMGIVCIADRRYDEADQAFEVLKRLEPTTTRGLNGLIESRFKQGEPAKGVEVARSEAAKVPDRRDYQLVLAATCARAERYAEAVEVLKKLLATPGEVPAREQVEVRVRLGEVLVRTGDAAGAIPVLEQARELAPQDARILITLGLALDAAGRKQDAGAAYAAVLKLEPRNAVVLNNYAFLLAETGGDLKLALEYAQRAREIMPNAVEVADTVGWIYLKAKMTAAAVDLFYGLVTRRPDNPNFRYHYAMALEQSGSRSAALKEAREALKLKPSAEYERQIKEMIKRLSAQPLAAPQ